MTEPPIGPAELLARFVYEASKVRTGRVHFRAFFDPGSNGISVSRVSGLSDAEVWAIGDGDGSPRGPAIASGDIEAGKIFDLQLQVAPDPPPPRHALIVGWDMTDKDRCRSVAQELAAVAALRLRGS